MRKIPNYVKQQIADFEAGKTQRGKAYIAHVAHDDWCAIWQSGICNCEPDIEYEPIDDYLSRIASQQ